jgi:hypothetical protein
MARSHTITAGDAAILRFLAAVELIESDLWVQYNEIGGVKGGNSAYMAALSNLDADMPQYITDNTDDELTDTRRVARGAVIAVCSRPAIGGLRDRRRPFGHVPARSTCFLDCVCCTTR